MQHKLDSCKKQKQKLLSSTLQTNLNVVASIIIGYCRIVEKMLMYYPEYVNLQKEDDGFALVHMAAANKQFEILHLLLQQVSWPLNSHPLTCLETLIC